MYDERIRREHCILYITSFTKSDRKVVAFSSPVSTFYSWNTWDHGSHFGVQEQLAFYDLGFPA